ncbi:MAG: tRNA (N(6)-L-threonylcarbamoyladenosine(37)-C(2))-methylthiotransferase [Candidatus Odinarchaeum yellowstonii]|uniref:tRNA-t(6)A37 methylthiotransferase n=1 Tax=Odinarchaeota yellowstonii (strain LCB_4) TaxID=1841599 RepID=A0AAF0D144_ODILC|nr:MAG: tRNA (N(6)-L-threonylcarbamoyladenosine(37)-C(2))-methylthiotransferase [Candidatus Odinarchaeum yellowstonii]
MVALAPGKIYIETFGCSLNLSDTEFLAGELLKKGFTLSSLDEADIIIVNTCAVKEPTERKVLNYLRRIDKLDKVKIIAGCLPKVNLESVKKAIPSFNAVIAPSAYPRISEVLEAVLNGVKGLIVDDVLQPPLLRDFQAKNKIGIIPIAYGCLSECAYCCVRLARGRLRSYSISEITEYASRLVERGCVELWLTAQDTAAYGLDINTDLSRLISVVNMIPGDFKVRVGMMNPKNAYKIISPLIEAFSGDKIYKFIHIPVQSGDDDILKKMNRGYNVTVFRDIINKFRERHPSITVSTDIIVGFPGESEIQFENSLKLIRTIQPDIVNISRYGDRPGAYSVNLPGKIRGSVIKKRSRILTELVREISLEKNSKWLNWTGEARIVEEAPRNGYIARNYAYKPIFLKSNQIKIGEKYLIRVIDYKPGYLIGELA